MKAWYGFCGVDGDGNPVSPVTKQPDWDTSRREGVTMKMVEVRAASESPAIQKAFAILRTGGDFATASEQSGIPAAVLITMWNAPFAPAE